MRFIRIPSCLIASLLGCIWLAACSAVPGSTLITARLSGDEIEVSEIRRSPFCAAEGDQAAVQLIADAAALRDWQQVRGIDLIGSAPLPAGPFAVIDHGTRATGGYGLVVSRRARLRNGALKLTASFLSPKADEFRGYALVSPCVLVALPAGRYGSVEVVDPAGQRRAITAAAAP